MLGFFYADFESAITRRVLFRTPSYTEVIDDVVEDVVRGRAVTAVRADRESGKLSLIQIIASKLQSRERIALVINAASATPDEVARLIGRALRITGAEGLGANRLVERLAARETSDKLVLLFDQAESLSSVVFRFLILLLQLLDRRPTTLQLVLLGSLDEWPGLQPPDLDLMRQAASSLHVVKAAYHGPRQDHGRRPVKAERVTTIETERLDRAQALFRSLDMFLEAAVAGGRSNGRRRVLIASFCTLIVGGAAIPLIMNEAPASRGEPTRITGPAPSLSASSAEVSGETLELEMSPQTKRPDEAAPGTEMAEHPSVPADMPSSQNEQASSPNARPHADEAPASTPPPDTAARDIGTAQRPSMPPALPSRRVEHGGSLAVGADHPHRPRRAAPGLVLVASTGDDLPSLYAKVYRRVRPPSYAQFVSANRAPIKPGSIVIFPEPPGGWPSR